MMSDTFLGKSRRFATNIAHTSFKRNEQRRFDKKKMKVGDQDYQRMLFEEINIWAHNRECYIGSQGKADFEVLKKSLIYQTYRNGTVEREFSFIPSGSKVLELGSAEGWLSNELLKKQCLVTAIDITVEELSSSYTDGVLRVKGDINLIEQITGLEKYDVIISHGLFHHLVDPGKVVTYVYKNLLNDGGVFIINDTYMPRRYELVLNASIYIIFNRCNFKSIMSTIRTLLKVITVFIIPSYGESVVHCHGLSPFESISSAKDWWDTYKKLFNVLEFRSFGGLASFSNIKIQSEHIREIYQKFCIKIINPIDRKLIQMGILKGDVFYVVGRKNRV